MLGNTLQPPAMPGQHAPGNAGHAPHDPMLSHTSGAQKAAYG